MIWRECCYHTFDVHLRSVRRDAAIQCDRIPDINGYQNVFLHNPAFLRVIFTETVSVVNFLRLLLLIKTGK